MCVMCSQPKSFPSKFCTHSCEREYIRKNDGMDMKRVNEIDAQIQRLLEERNLLMSFMGTSKSIRD